MKKSNIVYLVIIIYLNIFGSCNKYLPNEYVDFRFQIPLSITPIKDTINVGDTLTLEADFYDSIREVHSGQLYKLQGFDFKTRVAFKKIGDTAVDLSSHPGNAGIYKFIQQVGAIAGLGGTYGGILFDSSNSRYKLKVRLIPTEKGVSSISFFSRYIDGMTQLSFIDLGTAPSGAKRIAVLRNVLYLINNGKTNFDLYKKNSKVGNLNIIDERNYETEATYTFVVK